MTLTNNAEYKVRNLAFSKYIKGSGADPDVLGHYTFNANDEDFVFTAESHVLITEQFYKFKTADDKYWTVDASNAGALTLEDELSTTGNAFYRQLFKLIDVSQGVVMLAPRSALNSRVQLAGPLVDEGRYIQVFSTQVNQASEQFAFELVSSEAVVERPIVRTPVYSHHESIFVENVEAAASIQLYISGAAYGPQRTNAAPGTATIEIAVSGLVKGNMISVQAFKTGESPSVSETARVQEAAAVIRVRNPNGTDTYNLEVVEIESGTTSETAKAKRFATPKILASGLASAAASEAARTAALYVKNQL